MPSFENVATIVAGGQRYSAWKSVMVRRDYGSAYSTFHFTAAEPGDYAGGWSALKLKPGDVCQIYLGGVKAIDGSITVRNAAYDAEQHDLVVQGMSKTADMESSIPIRPGTFSGYTFEQAARAVLQPHGIKLRVVNPSDIVSMPFANLVVQYGETVFEFIERMARFRGLILTDDENGNLVASQVNPADTPVAELVEGRNILRASCRLRDDTLWSPLSFVGQTPGTDDDWPGRDHSVTLTNPNARPNRGQLFVSEMPAMQRELQERANYEAARCLWPSVECSITVPGWFQSPGTLWTPTKNVTVRSPMLFPSSDGSAPPLGIQATIFQQDENEGTTTTLELKLSNALTTRPDPFDGKGPGNPISNPRPNQATADGADFSL